MNNLAVLKKRIFGVPPSLILIFFFLPWITVSCSGQSSSASGYQLAVEGSGVPGDVRIPILAIGIAAVVALGVAVATNPLSRRFYTGAGLVAGASYLYLLLRFGAFAEEARRQGGTLTLELAVWGVGLAIMSIIGLGALYRPDESKLVSPDPNKAATADSRAQQAQQEKMVQYAIFAVLAVVGGVFLLSLFQSIGADLERRQVISNATATRAAVIQADFDRRATATAQSIAAASATAFANATNTVVAMDNAATAQAIDAVLSTDPDSLLSEQAAIEFSPETRNPGAVFFRYPAGWRVTQVLDRYYNTLQIANEDVVLQLSYRKHFEPFLRYSSDLEREIRSSTDVQSRGQGEFRTIPRYGHDIQVYSRIDVLKSGRHEYVAAAFLFTYETGGNFIQLKASGRFEPYIGIFDAILSTISFDDIGVISFFQFESPDQLMPQFEWTPNGGSFAQWYSRFNTRLPGDVNRQTITLRGIESANDYPKLCYPASGNIDARVSFGGKAFFYIQTSNQQIGFQRSDQSRYLRFYRVVDGTEFQANWLDNFSIGDRLKIVYNDGRIDLYYWNKSSNQQLGDWALLIGDVQVDLPEAYQICVGGTGIFSNLQIFGEAMKTKTVNRYQPIPIIDASQPFILKASDYWLDTFLDVQAGEMITITAEGSIRLCYTNACPINGPEGILRWDSRWGDHDRYLILRIPYRTYESGDGPRVGQLLARIGDGEPIVIGENRTIGISKSGRLYLTVNDSPYLFGDNSGEFEINIYQGGMPTRTPAPTHTPTSTPTSTVTRTPTQTRTPATPTATLAEADVVATGVAATLAALQAPTQNPTPVIDHTLNCSQSVASLDLRNGASVVAVCPQNCAQSGGTVWGTDIYTHDSSICTAALHSGIAENQPFRIEVLPGQNSYRGSTRNGIQTSSYGSWSLSFRVTVIE